MPDPSVNETDKSLKELSIGNQKCDKADANADRDMIPMCPPSFQVTQKNQHP